MQKVKQKKMRRRKQLKLQVSKSPYCLPYSSCDISLENLVLDWLIIPLLIFFFILITCLLDIVLILLGEILSQSPMGVKGLITYSKSYWWEYKLKRLKLEGCVSHTTF